jgi:heme-degrading monooxygenase HmoA
VVKLRSPILGAVFAGFEPAAPIWNLEPMISIVWQFEIAPPSQAEFEKHYGPQGSWVELFRRSPAFRGTTLLRDREIPNRYISIDRWDDLSSYDAFRKRFAGEYEELDARMESLTISETKIGVFEAIDDPG